MGLKRNILASILLFGVLAYPLTGTSQTITDVKLKNTVIAFNGAHQLIPVEKLYVQTDKPYYSMGDTIRLKGYLLNADYLTPSALSGLLYVELDDESGKMAKRMMLPLISGLAWGDIPLDSAATPKGNYTLRAYTTWMRNFGEDYIFKKAISITEFDNDPLLVRSAFKQTGSNVEAELALNLLNGRIAAFRDVELQVMNGKRSITKGKLVSGADGTLRMNFSLPEQTNKGALLIKAQTARSAGLLIPVTLNRPEETDLQFLPEGGNLVAGLPIKVAFKAVNEDGKGAEVSGSIFNSKGAAVASFKTLHAGMGSFELSPVAGEIYTAKISGVNKVYTLPAVNPSGTTLSVKTGNADSLIVTVQGTPNTAISTFYLIGQSRNVICYAKAVGSSSSLSLAKNLFPTGIARFSLLGGDYQPLNERIVFINRNDQLKINIAAGKPAYGIRDSISLNLTVTDEGGKPVKGNFSLAVTDDSQVKTDSLGSNILNHLLFTADLKGEVEQPGYYFTGNKATELDNLMLTQGWVGFKWNDVFHPEYPLPYKPEKEFAINGRVKNILGKPLEKSNVILFASRPTLIIRDTLTDAEGRFSFKDIFPVDTALFKIQARNKRNKEFNVGIEMDEVKAPVFKPAQPANPWYVNTDTVLLNNMKVKRQETIAKDNYRGEGRVLKVVNIKAKKIVKDSKNLNGPGEADQILDEEDMKKADKKTLNDLLREKVKGFAERGLWTPCETCKTIPFDYVMNFKRLHFIFDGINLDFFYSGSPDRYNFIKSYLSYYTAEDVTGIEVMSTSRYAGLYAAYANPNYEAYIEITTRSKQGPFMKVTPGTYLYKTLAFTLPKEFYRPKYTISNRSMAMGTDLRSTIHWDPNVMTDASGKATISFYSADKAATYSVIVEGGDLDGLLGFGTQKVTVK